MPTRQVQAGMEASQVAELAVPTLGAGESYADLLADPQRVRGLRRQMRRPSGVRLRSAWTSWRSSTFSAPAERGLGVSLVAEWTPRPRPARSSYARPTPVPLSGRAAPHTPTEPRSIRWRGGRRSRRAAHDAGGLGDAQLR
ncbi:MAG: hypothetical protein WKF47_12720 [Geodermatophilaceae bacterium]